MQDKEAARDKARKHYSKPEMRRVELKPQECLAAGCKTVSTSNTGGSDCSVMSCQELGS
jgi:hypothetical protein